MILVFVAIFALAIFAFSLLNWRAAISAVFVLLVVEGALRKWVLPGASDFVYFLKDLLLLGPYLHFIVTAKRLPFKLSFINIWIFLVTGWCLVQAFNPSLGSPIVGLFGLRGYLFYIPLMWILPVMLTTEEALSKFVRSHLLLMIPVGLLGIAQFFSPANSPLNVYTPDSLEVATFGVSTAVRVTGTFSYISGFSIFLLVCFGLLIPLLSIPQSPLWRFLTVTELLLVLINSFMTGARGLLLFEILFLATYIGFKFLTRPSSAIALFRQLIPALILVSAITAIWFRPAVDAFWQRTTANQDISARISGGFLEPVNNFQYTEFDGYGTGATHQATPALRGALRLPAGEGIPVYFEGELGRIALELGPIGFLFWYGLRLSLIGALLATYFQVHRPFLKELALSAFLIQLIQITAQLVFHHTFSVYYWFFSSFIYLLPQLERSHAFLHSGTPWASHDSSPALARPPYQ